MEERAKIEFIEDIKNLSEYWATIPNPFIKEGESELQARLNGLAFSILSILDDVSCGSSVESIKINGVKIKERNLHDIFSSIR